MVTVKIHSSEYPAHVIPLVEQELTDVFGRLVIVLQKPDGSGVTVNIPDCQPNRFVVKSLLYRVHKINHLKHLICT